MSEDRVVRKKRRKLGGWHVLILGLVVLVGGVGFYRWRQKSKLEVRIEAIRAAGLPASCAELDEWYSIPADAENAADVVLDAASWYFEPNEPDLVPEMGEAKWPGRTEGLSDEMKKTLGEYLAENKKTLELLHETAGMEHSRYPVNLAAGFAVMLPHLSSIRDMARLLKVEAIMHIEDGQADEAIESVAAIFGVARSMSEEPVLISQLIRVGCEWYGVSAIERIVNRSELDNEQLAGLAEMIAGAGKGLNFRISLMGDRCCLLDMFRDPARVDQSLIGGPRIPGVLLMAFKATGLSDKAGIQYLDFTDEFLQAMELPERERTAAVKAIEKKLEEARGIQMMMLRMFAPAYTHLVDLDLRSVAHFRAARAGLAVERYRLAAGKRPGTLGELVGEYLDVVPKDPFDGAELRYIRLEEGFVVYSIGEDGSDDGGAEKNKGNKDSWDITFTVER